MTPIAEVTNSQEPLACFDTISQFLSNLPPSKRPAGINIFSQLSPSETEHSTILCELLNPRGKHNEGSKFLKLFFDYVIEDIPFDDDKKPWIVTAEKERFDVQIRNSDDSTIIIIENKSNRAGDGWNQLYRYCLRIKKKQKYLEKAQGKILYLTPDSNKLPDDQTMIPPTDEYPPMPDGMIKIVFFHQNIDKWLEECIKSVEDKSDICYYLKQYRDFWRLKMNYDIDQINELFRDKKEQWYSFLDLVNDKKNIEDAWWENFFKKMDKKFSDKGNWKHILKDRFYCCWFIKDFNPKSFCLNVFLDDGKYFSLSLGSDTLSKDALKKISDLLQKEDYKEPLKAGFDSRDDLSNKDEKHHKFVEYCNFVIKGDEIKNLEKLAWYAYYEPDNLIEEVTKKIYKFIEDEEITEIITKINQEVFGQQ